MNDKDYIITPIKIAGNKAVQIAPPYSCSTIQLTHKQIRKLIKDLTKILEC
jgi:hypothetical protein